jgi:hypothetical protein
MTHRAPEPKKVSFLGSAGGLFAAIIIAFGLALGTQIITGDNPIGAPEPVQPNKPHVAEPFEPSIEERINELLGSPVLLGSVETPASSAVDGRNNAPGARPPVSRPQIPGPIQPPIPGAPNVPPTLPPVQVPDNTDVTVRVQADTPIARVDTKARVRVPLATIVTEVATPVNETVDGITNTVKDILGH